LVELLAGELIGGQATVCDGGCGGGEERRRKKEKVLAMWRGKML
jgi:hypothetical protein